MARKEGQGRKGSKTVPPDNTGPWERRRPARSGPQVRGRKPVTRRTLAAWQKREKAAHGTEKEQ